MNCHHDFGNSESRLVACIKCGETRQDIELAELEPRALPADVVALLEDILKPDPSCIAIFAQRDRIRQLLEKYA